MIPVGRKLTPDFEGVSQHLSETKVIRIHVVDDFQRDSGAPPAHVERERGGGGGGWTPAGEGATGGASQGTTRTRGSVSAGEVGGGGEREPAAPALGERDGEPADVE